MRLCTSQNVKALHLELIYTIVSLCARNNFELTVFDMAASSKHRSRIRWSYDVPFSCQEDKQAFQATLDAIRRLLDPADKLDRHGVMCAMLDIVERSIRPTFTGTRSRQSELLEERPADVQSFLTNNGKT